MIEKFCLFLTNKIREKVPDIDDERAEAITYGLQIMVGEVPKTFIILALSYFLGVFELTLLAFVLLLPYRGFSGGFHLHTHIGCILASTAMYSGVALLSKYVVFDEITKYIVIVIVWLFGMIMIKLYAPADTADVPILQKKVRRKKQILSFISFSVGLGVAIFIPSGIVSNTLIFGNLIQTLTITKLVYRLTNNKYGYEVYGNASEQIS